jgi:hypothetical protein
MVCHYYWTKSKKDKNESSDNYQHTTESQDETDHEVQQDDQNINDIAQPDTSELCTSVNGKTNWQIIKTMDSYDDIVNHLNSRNEEYGSLLPDFHQGLLSSKIKRGETYSRWFLEQLFNKTFNKVRLKDMYNPITGRPLEFDAYNGDIKLAAEYNGIHHYKWPNFTGCTYEQFQQQQYRDKIKVKFCSDNEILFLRIPYTVDINKLPYYIYCKLLDYISIKHPVLMRKIKTDERITKVSDQNNEQNILPSSGSQASI